MIEQGVKDVYTSDNFRNYLSMLTKFHDYSFNNVMLILSQYPTASLVAGYSRWQNDFNRQVNKGEKAIKILAPYQVDLKKLRESNDENGNVVQTEEIVKVTRFRVVNVFDINQTNGEPLPELISDLEGTSFNARALIESIKSVTKIPIEFKTANEDWDLRNGAKGYYSVTLDKIVVNKELDDIQISKTLAHEFAHSILHKDSKKEQSQREIEAESLAFVICDHFGIDTSDYSFGYIASYAKNDTETLKTILQNIQVEAKEIIDTLDPIFKIHLAEIQVENKYFSPVEMEKLAQPLLQEIFKDIEGTDIYDAIKCMDPGDINYAKEGIDIEIRELMSNHKDDYPLQVALYTESLKFREGFHETMYTMCMEDLYDQKLSRPFLTNSLEFKNYCAMEKMARPVLESEANYMRLSSKGMMDLSIERITDEHVAMAHYGELNGDAMADPDICYFVDTKNCLLIPETFQNDYLSSYQTTAENPQLTDDLNVYTDTWMRTIKGMQYKISEIHTEEKEMTDPKEIYKYSRQNGIKEFAKKPQEKDAR